MRIEGQKLGGRYEILHRVGGGGMANVYKARDSLLNRFVAVKLLNESLSNDAEFVSRFSREAQAAASLSHPNIVSVYDVGREDYKHYIVMELVDGPTLKEYILERAPLSLGEFADIITQICDALKHAHDNSVVHRDIKPHNILLGSNGRVKVTDFGIARAASAATITRTGAVMGSVHYFSPEQARGGVINERSDIYSLGVIMYEMLAGTLLFEGDSAISIALKHLQESPVPLSKMNESVPDNINKLIMSMLDKDSAHRPASAHEVSIELRKSIDIEPFVILSTSRKTIAGNQPSEVAVAQVSLPNKSRKEFQSVDLSEQTILQRTSTWINNVSKSLPWWKKALFSLFTFVLVVSLSTGGFITLWGWISKDRNWSSGRVELVKFATIQEARRWLSDNNFKNKEPRLVYVPNGPGKPNDVIAQLPASGSSVDRSEAVVTLHVAGSPGPEAGFVLVKDYFKMYESRIEEDMNKVDQLGYNVQIIWCNDEGSKSVDESQAYRQEPKAGTEIQKGEVVKVYVRVSNIGKCRPSNNSMKSLQ